MIYHDVNDVLFKLLLPFLFDDEHVILVMMTKIRMTFVKAPW